MVGDSRKLFDVFYRSLLIGEVADHPKPAKFKLTKHQIFPEKGTVWDWIFDKKNNGCWIQWLETIDKVQTGATTKVCTITSVFMLLNLLIFFNHWSKQLFWHQ